MTLNSVAMIIAPNLFVVGTSPQVGSSGARRGPKRLRELLEVSTAAGISSVIRLFIYYQDLLWQVKHSSDHDTVMLPLLPGAALRGGTRGLEPPVWEFGRFCRG